MFRSHRIVMAGLVPAIPMIVAPAMLIGIAGTSPAMTAVGAAIPSQGV
jgi:hypothetical protein